MLTPADVTFHVFSNMDHRSDGKKQAQITCNLFHFSRHRVPCIQDGGKGVWEAGWFNWYFRLIFIYFYNISDEHLGLYTCTHWKQHFVVWLQFKSVGIYYILFIIHI